MITSAVLITDFSSVSWDFSFLRRPVLYFQFDQELLTGPGPRTSTSPPTSPDPW